MTFAGAPFASTPFAGAMPRFINGKQSVDLVLNSIVIPGDKTHEGVLVEAVGIIWRDLLKLIEADPEIIHRIDHRKWEEIVAASYKDAGFDDVILTPRSGDYGRDVIAVKRGVGAIRFLDQVKAYSPGHVVTLEEVDAMIGVMGRERNVSKGVVTTTSDFAPKLLEAPGIRELIPYRLELVNGVELVNRLSKLAEKPVDLGP